MTDTDIAKVETDAEKLSADLEGVVIIKSDADKLFADLYQIEQELKAHSLSLGSLLKEWLKKSHGISLSTEQPTPVAETKS